MSTFTPKLSNTPSSLYMYSSKPTIMNLDVDSWNDNTLIDIFNNDLKIYQNIHYNINNGSDSNNTDSNIVIYPEISTKDAILEKSENISIDLHKTISKSNDRLNKISENLKNNLDNNTRNQSTTNNNIESSINNDNTSHQPSITTAFEKKIADDALADLLMSWYYAGLYEGKQQTLNELKKQNNK